MEDGFHGIPKGVYTLHKFWGVFLDMYNYLDTLELVRKFWGISNIFDVFMTSLMSDFLVILQFLATASVIKFVETLDFHIEYVFW